MDSVTGAGAPPSASAAQAKTAYMSPDAGAGAPPMAPPLPNLTAPTPAHNITMAIAMPPGHRDRPPRRTSLLWVAVGFGLVVGGVGVAGFVTPGFFVDKSEGDGDEVGSVSVATSVNRTVPAVIADAAPVAVDAGPALVSVRVISSPEGAEVLDSSGVVLATTPGVIELPADGVERALVFRHPDAEDKKTTVVPTSDTILRVELSARKDRDRDDADARERRRQRREARRKPRPRPKPKPKPDNDGTLRPKFD